MEPCHTQRINRKNVNNNLTHSGTLDLGLKQNICLWPYNSTP